MAIINSRSDFASATPEDRAKAIDAIITSIWNWDWVEDQKDWALRQDMSQAERLGLVAGVDYTIPEPPPKPAIPTPEFPQPDPIAAYKALLISPLFQAVGSAAEVSIATNRHYTDLGLSLQSKDWIPEATAAAIANLNSTYVFSEADRTFVEGWVSVYNLDIQLPWS